MKSAKAQSKPRRYIQGARADAAEANGRRIIDAFLARLMTQWFDEIRLDGVAEDAGTTVQTIIRRYGGKEGLLGEAVQVLAEQISAARAMPAGSLDRVVQSLLADYEKTGDAVVRLLALEPRHPALKAVLDLGREWHRRWIAGVFNDNLDRLAGAQRERAIDALVIVTDVYTWKLLRRDMGRTVPAAKAAMKQLIGAAVSQISGQNQSGDAQ